MCRKTLRAPFWVWVEQTDVLMNSRPPLIQFFWVTHPSQTCAVGVLLITQVCACRLPGSAVYQTICLFPFDSNSFSLSRKTWILTELLETDLRFPGVVHQVAQILQVDHGLLLTVEVRLFILAAGFHQFHLKQKFSLVCGFSSHEATEQHRGDEGLPAAALSSCGSEFVTFRGEEAGSTLPWQHIICAMRRPDGACEHVNVKWRNLHFRLDFTRGID